MSAFNLVSTAWLPVVRASGQRERIRPGHITSRLAIDPIVDVDLARADFRCATIEFLIGLLTVAYPPGDDWGARWNNPPSGPELDAAFSPLLSAFTFDGDGPQPYQDYEDFASDATPVEGLLIEAPGAETVRKNAALFVKPRIGVLSISSAATALLTLQTMAPEGGRGYRTSLRGGGPLTTLIAPKAPALWHRLWANVSSGDSPPTPAEFPHVFPWLTHARLSNEDGRTTTPEDVDWRQVYFGMPCRIRLNLESNTDRLPCDLTGVVEDVIVRSYRTLPYGINYKAWVHPLTPHSRKKPSDRALNPVHAKEGRMGYRQWVAML
jgi:CRISPR system Cascade subunit CasA